MKTIDGYRSPLEQFRGEAMRRAERFGLADDKDIVELTMLALAYEATMRDTKPMRDALASTLATCLPTGLWISQDGSITPMEPSPEFKRLQALLQEHVVTVAKSYGITASFFDAPPPTSPPASGSGQ